MAKWRQCRNLMMIFAFVLSSAIGCKENKSNNANELAYSSEASGTEITKEPKKPLSEEFKTYWYDGTAEITSYELRQARYGELRDGKSVLVFVTEPFLPEVQVKADKSGAENVSVLKLNATKKYLTGIYPYSIMASTFYPVHDNQHALKTNLSVQEWCGHVYTQLNNRERFEISSHSYFEGEADQSFTLDKAVLENEIWNKIRIDPADLPLGDLKVIPSLEYFRVAHQEIQAFNASATLSTENGISTYTLDYTTIERKISIDFTADFPHTIEGWTEEFSSGFGQNTKLLTSTAKKLKRIKTAYWRQNSNEDVALRDSLAL